MNIIFVIVEVGWIIKFLNHIKQKIYIAEHIFKNGMSDIFSDRTSQQKGMWTIFHSVKAIIFPKTKICLVTKFTHEIYERDVSTCRLLSWDGYKQKIFISRNWIYSSTFILEIGELTHKQVDIRTRRLEKY